MGRYEELERLSKLYRDGLIDEQEYQTEKSVLLQSVSSLQNNNPNHTPNNNDNISGLPITTLKNQIITLLLCFFLGDFGLHRFYLGKKMSALIMFVISIFVVLFSASLVFAFFKPQSSNTFAWEYIGEPIYSSQIFFNEAQNFSISFRVGFCFFLYLILFTWKFTDLFRIIFGKMRDSKNRLLQI